MELGQSIKSFTFWQRLIRTVLFFLIAWQIGVLSHLFTIFKGTREFFSNGYLLPYPVITSSLALLAWVFVFMVGYTIFIFWLAQFVLPVTSFWDRFQAAWRLFLFSIDRGLHGAAIFVRDGKLIADLSELEKNGPGVVFVDLRSAITLNKRLDPKQPISPSSLEQPQKAEFDPKTNTYVSHVRVEGPVLRLRVQMRRSQARSIFENRPAPESQS
jgi:hypothetical protein